MSFTFLRSLIGVVLSFAVLQIGAAKAAPPLTTYGKLPGLEMASLSPSGNRIALVGVVGETRSVIILDKDQNVLSTNALGDLKLRSLVWAGDDRVLARVSHTVALGIGFTASKTELSTVWVIPVDGGKPWGIFERNSKITGGVRGYYGLIERQGRWFGIFGGITLAGGGKSEYYLGSTDAELYEVDLQTGKSARIARRMEGDNVSRDWLIGPDGQVVVSLDFFSRAGDWRIKNADGKIIASGRSPTGDVDLVSLGRTPETIIYYDKDEKTGAEHWFELPVGGGTATAILEDEEIRASYIDSRSRQLVGYLRDGDSPEAHFYDPRYAKVMRATQRAFPQLNVKLIDWNDAFDRLIVQTDGIGDPGTWWLVDIKTGAAKDLGISYTVASQDVGPMRMIRYKAADGLGISGVLTVPPGREAKNLPVVIFPHGGPKGRDYPNFNWWAQAFAARGYAVFQPNFRGSTGYGTAFEKAGHGEWGRKMQTDISDGLEELARQGIVDGKRACIMGASYGGYAALAGVTLQQGLYRCAVSVAGISDVLQLYQTDVQRSGSDPTLIRSLKEEIGSGRDLKDVSPIRFAKLADAPILLIHGKDDIIVLHEQSKAMERALLAAGKPVELLTLAGEDHWLSKSATRLAMLQAAVAFVERHNPPDPPK